MTSIVKDLRHAIRILAKSPGFTFVALVSLAIGIGANTAIFSLVNAVMLRPMPVAEPDALVSIFQADERNPGNLPVSHLNWKDLRAQNTSFEDIAAISFGQVNAQTGSGDADQEQIQVVSGNYFDVMRVKLIAGRGFRPEEDGGPGSGPVAVISWPYWQTKFGGDASIVGKTITFNRTPVTVIGVTPRTFTGTFALGTPSAWVPMSMHTALQPAIQWYEQRRGLFIFPVGRLKPGVTIEQATANLQAVMANLSKQYPVDNARRGAVRTLPLAESRIDPNGQGELRQLSNLLLAVVGVVLLIACANIANLLLARASKRKRELAVRLAIGANRMRLIRQLLTESVVLSVTGGALGVLLAYWMVRALAAAEGVLPLPIDDTGIALDPGVLAFTAALSVLTGVLFGLAPALEASRTDVIGSIKRESLASGDGRGWLRQGLVASQVALSVASLVAAGWFVRSLMATVNIEPGFATANVATLAVNLGREGYNAERGTVFYKQMLERARAMPGVEVASLAQSVPLGGTQFSRSVYVAKQDTTERDVRLTPVNVVSPGYFSTAEIPVLKGRDFDDRDVTGAPSVAIVNETMAKQYWPDQDPVGQRFHFFGEEAATEVIGVVRDSKVNNLAENPAPLIYEPIFQDYSGFANLMVRTDRPAAPMASQLRGVVTGLDPAVSVLNLQTLDQQVENSLTGQRSLTIVVGIFGAIALLLAAIGLYGVASFWVGMRTREIGVRMALGARPLAMLWLVVRQSMLVVAFGLGAGLVIAIAAAVLLGPQISTLLVRVSPTDPLVFVGTSVVLLLVALLACATPARRAARIDPLTALRQD